jgi:helicase
MFISGDKYIEKQEKGRKLNATQLGVRVSQIYLDPLSANTIIEGLIDLTNKKIELKEETKSFVINHLLVSTLEMRPLIRTKVKEYDEYLIKEEIDEVVINEEKFYNLSTDDFVDTIKTTSCIMDWCNELNEDKLLEKYNVRPGELSAKIRKMEWLYYGAEELARIKGLQPLIKTIKHNKERVVNGVKAELITLLRFKGIGRVRARKLYNNNVRNVTDIKNNSFPLLAQFIGTSVAKNLKEQVGETVDIKDINPVRPTKKHPQTKISKYF